MHASRKKLHASRKPTTYTGLVVFPVQRPPRLIFGNSRLKEILLFLEINELRHQTGGALNWEDH